MQKYKKEKWACPVNIEKGCFQEINKLKRK